MLRRDYIQRMIEDFARVVAKALGMKGTAHTGDAVREIREAYRTWFALDADTMNSFSAEEFKDKITGDSDFPAEKIEALAFGLKAEAELLSPADPDAADRRDKALALFHYLESADKANFSFTRKAAIAELQNLISE